MTQTHCSSLSCAAVLLGICAAGGALHAQVTFDRIVRAAAEPENWLTYSGDVFSRRHSPLTQITPANVKNLELQWVFQAQSLEKFEATPLAVDGVLYTVQPPNDVVALDGTTGRIFWTYSYKPSQQARPCCGRVNRGLAILGDRLFMGTIDGHLHRGRREERPAALERRRRRRAAGSRLRLHRRAARSSRTR